MQGVPLRKIYLSNLKQGPTGDAVCVKVLRKWIYDGKEHGVNIVYVGLVLADEKGDYIYGNISSKHMEKKEPLVQLDKTYLLRKFTVRPSRQTYVPFIKQYMIEFSAFTEAVEVQDPPPTLPNYIYNITAFGDLNPIPPQNTVYADVLGIVVSVGDKQEQRITSKERVVLMREIIIKNLREEELKVTLWADNAANFKLPGANTPETAQSFVVLFVGCVPKIISHKTQVNGGYGCRWYFNPDIKEAQPLYESLKRNPVPVYQIEDPDPDTMEHIQPVILEHQKLADINPKDPYTFADEGYKCTVTVTAIPEDQKYWYIGCAKCKVAQKEAMATFCCSECKCTQSSTFYKLSFTTEDDSAQAKFFAYDVAARNIVKRDVKAVLRQQANEPGFPRFLKETISRKFTFHIMLQDDSYDNLDDKVYLVKAVLVDYEFEAYWAKKRPQIDSKMASSSQSPALPSNQSPPQLTYQTVDAMPPTPAQVTPPPPIDHAATSQKLDLPSTSKSSTDIEKSPVRRALFQKDQTHATEDEALQALETSTEQKDEIDNDTLDEITMTKQPQESKSKRNPTDQPSKQPKTKQQKRGPNNSTQ